MQTYSFKENGIKINGSLGDYNDNNWHYITFTSDSGDHKLYMDGALAGTLVGNPISDERLFILGRREGEGNFPGFYSGTLD